jgi:hypothetical protein
MEAAPADTIGRQQAHHDDGPPDPGRFARSRRSSGPLAQGLDAARRVAPPPAMEAGPAGTEREGRADALGPRR